MDEVTQILKQIDQGDSQAADQLLPLVYFELRRLASAKLAHEKPGQTLQATALVHEAYLRLVNVANPQDWNSRGHFFVAAAEAMRRILVEQVRRKQSERRGGHLIRVELDDNPLSLEGRNDDDCILALHEALNDLESSSPRKAQLVKLRFFTGMTLEEAAEIQGVSLATVKRDWAAARVWLYRRMSETE